MSQQSISPVDIFTTRPGHPPVSVDTEQASNRTRQSAQSPHGQGSYRSASHHSTKASIDKRSHRVRPLQVIPTHTTALLTTASTYTARPKRKQISPAFSSRQHPSGKPTGGCPGRSIRSAERREKARIRPQDVGERRSRARDGPSAPVRQADERREGTAQRREDPPGQGIRRSARTPNRSAIASAKTIKPKRKQTTLPFHPDDTHPGSRPAGALAGASAG